MSLQCTWDVFFPNQKWIWEAYGAVLPSHWNKNKKKVSSSSLFKPFGGALLPQETICTVTTGNQKNFKLYSNDDVADVEMLKNIVSFLQRLSSGQNLCRATIVFLLAEYKIHLISARMIFQHFWGRIQFANERQMLNLKNWCSWDTKQTCKRRYESPS